MQKTSKEYRESIKNYNRNRGYIKVKIGVLNKEATSGAYLSEKNSFLPFSIDEIPDTSDESRIYATMEENFTDISGKMYFLPVDEQSYYKNALISTDIKGSVYINFSKTPLDIKGLTINFGDSFPTRFTVDYGAGTKTFDNAEPVFYTEDVFYNVSQMVITPITMVGGEQRTRIYELLFGIIKTFSNNEALNYSFSEHISPISEDLPSQDMSLTVDNQDQYYSADVPESVFSFLEIGQEMEVSIGYDIDGNGQIEWLAPNTCYLSSWTATDTDATFNATDIFDYNDSTYYRGTYNENGESLYNLAVDVFEDMGITEEHYFVDQYLKNIYSKNAIPVATHKEALQIIANAGRCTLSIDRQKKINIRASFVPDMSVETNGETQYSNADSILLDTDNMFYAEHSNDFSMVDESMLFMPNEDNYMNSGYISNQISDSEGLFDENPTITVSMEAGFSPQAIGITFVSVYPEELKVFGYYGGSLIEEHIVTDLQLEWSEEWYYGEVDEIRFEFTKNIPNSRIFINKLSIGHYPVKKIERNDMTSSPTSEKQGKIKSISVKAYVPKIGENQVFSSGEVEIKSGTALEEIIITSPYEEVSVATEAENVTIAVEKVGSYVYKLAFSGDLEDGTKVSYELSGKEILFDEYLVEETLNSTGEIKEWDNPLIASEEQARDVLKWVSSYYKGDIEYTVPWRGDPAVDSGDLFLIELKAGGNVPVKSCENKFEFNGAFSGEMNCRKVVELE